jgi:hypothetical protein
MIDLETLGTRSDSVIISIGAVAFDPHAVGMLGLEFHGAIDLQSSVERGLHIDGSTVLWWFQQSEEARVSLVSRLKSAKPLVVVLDEFRMYLGCIAEHDEIRVWGNGADFDLALLQQAYEACKMERPWKYNAGRCYRTLTAQFGTEADRVRPELAHDALSDALAQARTAQNIFARLAR